MNTDPRSTAGDPHESLQAIVAGQDLDAERAEALFAGIMDGRVSETVIAAILAALAAKGETEAELFGAARVMRARAERVSTRRAPLLDTCGTGGDFSGSFNVSTAAALVVAATGIPVAKHGNRAASSRCGSADVLEQMGVVVDLGPADVGRTIDDLGIGFLFAPRFHPAMRHAIGARRAIRIRTLFNLLGPLTNPAGATRQVIGVPTVAAVKRLAHVLARLGTERALVVHGTEGLDEISVCGPTRFALVRDDGVEEGTLTPSDLGLGTFSPEELSGGDPARNGIILRQVLAGDGTGAQRAVVAGNAGAGIWIGGGAPDLRSGVERAVETLATGRPAALLETFASLTRRLAAAGSG